MGYGYNIDIGEELGSQNDDIIRITSPPVNKEQLRGYSQPTLKRFYDNLPYKPCCSDCKQLRFTCDKASAIGYPYIQVNFPVVRYIIFDIDHPGAVISAGENGLPSPTIIMTNRESGHGHLFYELADPVPRNPSSKTRELMKDVINAYRDILCADKCITTQMQLVKNPLHPQWDLETFDKLFTLVEMAEYIPDEWKKARNSNRQFNIGLMNNGIRSFEETLDAGSRHMSLFHNARYFAYSTVHECKSYNELYDRIFKWVSYLNDTEIPKYFSAQVGYPELKSISKSIADWVYKKRHHFRKVNGGAMQLPSMKGKIWTPEEYAAELKNRQTLSANRTNAIRKANTEAKIICAVEKCVLEGREITKNLISSITGLHRNTIRSYGHLLVC